MGMSAVQVFNLALTELGQDRCTNIDDDLEAVRTLRANWEFMRDDVFAEHPWKFAILRDSLPALAAAPPFGYARQFSLPEKCLKLVQVGDDYVFYTSETTTFALEGGTSGGQVILTDEAAPLQVRYVQRIENVGLWPVLFCSAVAMKLASVCAKKITGSSTEAERMVGLYQLAVRTAKRHNAIERPPQRMLDGDWLGSRDA